MYLTILLSVAAVLAYVVYRTLKAYEQIPLKSSALGIENEAKPLDTVVVIGASLAGLMTAEALSKHSTKVILVERSKSSATQSIVPQGSHTHAVLSRGFEIMETLFPGVREDIIQQGGIMSDWGSGVKWWANGGWRVPLEEGECGVQFIQTTRHTVESTVRNRVSANKRIETRYETEIVDLLTDAKDIRLITGVKIHNKVDDSFSTIDADLTVDCSGMLTQVPRFLEKRGISVRKASVKSYLQYATQQVRFNGEVPPFGACYYQPIAPDVWYGCVFWKIQHNEYFCTVVIINKNIPGHRVPTQQEEFMEFLKQMPVIYEWMVKAEPLSTVHTYNKEGNQYNFYEDLDMHGFVAIGDAVCNFNPVYGQGITASAEGVLLLDHMLRKETFTPGFCKGFQARLARQLSIPWLLAVLSDLRFAGTQTDNRILTKILPLTELLLVRWLESSAKSKETYKTFIQVLHLKEGFLWKVLNPRFIWALLTK